MTTAEHPNRPDDRYVTWDAMQADARALARALLRRNSAPSTWKGIVAITRGGMVPAAVVARELSIRVIDTLCIASYDGREQGALAVLKAPHGAVAARGAGWLLIDDIVDTGATAKAARDLLPEAVFGALYVKPEGRGLPDLVVHEVAQSVWVHFPWDTAAGDGDNAPHTYVPPMVSGEPS